jgi:hypothetical protein
MGKAIVFGVVKNPLQIELLAFEEDQGYDSDFVPADVDNIMFIQIFKII